MKTNIVKGITMAFFFGLAVLTANGALMASTTPGSVYETRAQDSKWASTVAILGETADGTRYFAGSGTVLSDPYSNDEYVWGAAHSADQEYVRYHAVNGTDLYNGFGLHYIADASMVTIDSRYNGTIESYDQMLIRYEGGMDGIDGLSLYTGSTVAGTSLEACGYGYPTTLANGELSWDGKKRAFSMTAEYLGSAFGSQYATSRFNNYSSIEAHGGASNGDSGGTVLDENGLVWGHMTWTSPEPGTVVDNRTTGILMASGNDWVYDTMYSISVPEPATVTFVVVFGGGLLVLRRRFRI